MLVENWKRKIDSIADWRQRDKIQALLHYEQAFSISSSKHVFEKNR